MLLLKQTSLSFLLTSPPLPPLPSLIRLAKETVDNRAKELLINALINETCRDDNVLQELMTYKEVFKSVQLHLAQKGQLYAPWTILDLQLLKQYTA
jgi:hypothetical protein